MNDVQKSSYSKLIVNQWRWLDLLTVLLFGLFVFLGIRYQIKLLSYIEWGDESETIVTAKMIAAGSSLYSQIFNHHGPLTFLPGVFLEKLGNFGIAGHRVSIAILQIAALISIYFSPLLKHSFTRRFYTVVAASVILLRFPEIFGHTYIYQVLAGLFLVIILSQYTLPSIVCPDNISSWNVVIGNVLIASLSFLAITYAPISLLLFFASLRKKFIAKSLVGVVGSSIANIMLLAYFGSITGFLAFHIYLNAKILPSYNGGQSGWQLVQNSINSATSDLSKFVCFLILVAAISRLAANEKGFPWRSISLAIGISSLLMRGIALHHGLPYFYSFLAISLIFFYDRSITQRQLQLLALMLMLFCIVKLSLVVPRDRQKFVTKKIPQSTEFSQLVQAFTGKNDRIIAYSFQNFQYIAADRLPASGHFFYLPWQEKYNENPKLGISINACKDISEYRPKVMLIDKWKVWDKYLWDSYASCIQSILDKDYIQFGDKPYYIRKELAPYDMGLHSNDSSTKMEPSVQLRVSDQIQLLMTAGHQHENAGLKRIGVMFGTYGRQNLGDAELRLKRPDGLEFTQRFSISDLADNKYRYFDIDSKRYTTGKILSISGGGVSTWESHDKMGSTYTCINYEYADGKRRFTPGCPFF